MDAIEAMVGTLSKSISDAIAADPTNTALLQKNFDEFKDVLVKHVHDEVELAKSEAGAEIGGGTAEEPLFKGLGCVGRIANMLSSIVSQVEMIKSGLEWRDQDKDKANDPASEDISTMLDHLLHLATLTLRAAVNEHVDMVDDDDEVQDGYHYVEVPTAEDSDHHIVVKTALPEDLAKFATDPGLIGQGIIEIGAGLMLDGGMTEEQLTKVFDGGDLAKSFPPKKKDPADDTSGPASNAAPGQPAADSDPGASGDPVPDDTSTDTSMESTGDPLVDGLNLIGRIAAALMIQLDQVMQIAQGGDDGSGGDDMTQGGDATQGTVGAPGTMGKDAANPVDVEELKKAILAEPLQQVDNLQKTVNDLKSRIATFEKQPAPPKGAVSAIGLSKAVDTGGEDINAELIKEANRIAALPEDQQQIEIGKVLMKRALSQPRPLAPQDIPGVTLGR